MALEVEKYVLIAGVVAQMHLCEVIIRDGEQWLPRCAGQLNPQEGKGQLSVLRKLGPIYCKALHFLAARRG